MELVHDFHQSLRGGVASHEDVLLAGAAFAPVVEHHRGPVHPVGVGPGIEGVLQRLPHVVGLGQGAQLLPQALQILQHPVQVLQIGPALFRQRPGGGGKGLPALDVQGEELLFLL